MFLILTECNNEETTNIHLSCHKHLMKEKKIAGSKLKILAATHQRALVQVHFSCLDQAGKTNQKELQERNITPTCTSASSFLLLGPSGENQSNRIVGKEISHQRALVQVHFSCLDQTGKTNVKSSAGKEIVGKGSLSTSHNGFAFTQT